MERIDEEPDYSNFIRNNELPIGWDKMKDNFLVFFIVVIIVMVLDSPFDGVDDADEYSAYNYLVNTLGALYFFLLRPVFEYGADWIFVKGIRNDTAELGTLFSGFKKDKYKNIVLTNLVVFCLVALSLMMLIIPGIIVACKLVFASYLVMDKDMQPLEAVEESWRLTNGKEGRIFVLGVGAIFIGILGLLFFIVGIIPAVMWVKSYFAVYYQMALNEDNARQA